MAQKTNDPTQAIRLKASRYPAVDEGTACTQSSFKTGKKAFLFIGMQGGRFKAMFKLNDSIAEATKLAQQRPDDFQVGSTAWVTARFSAEDPMPKQLWEKWLDESYALSVGSTGTKKPRKKSNGQETATKKAARKKK